MKINKLLKNFLFIGIGCGLMALLQYLVYDTNSAKTNSQTEIEWVDLNYKKKYLGNSNLIISTPFEIREIPYADYEDILPREWKDTFSELAFYNSTGIEFNCNFTYFKFQTNTPYAEDYLNSMANGAINNFNNAEGVSNLNVKVSNTTIAGLKGKEVDGTYNSSGISKSIKALIFTNGDYVWNFSFLFNSQNNTELNIVKTIIDSIAIEK